MNSIYLDYNATTPVDPSVAEAMMPFLYGEFGNPSSIHEYGINARRFVETARIHLAEMLNAGPDEIIFTGGGTESNNLALCGYAFSHKDSGDHIITSCIEHPAVLQVCRFLETCGFRITYLRVDGHGSVDPDDFRKAIVPGTILASIMHANNEVGTIQNVNELSRIARERGIVFHCDAAQSIGKITVDVNELGADLLSVAGHKFYAPKGVGALYIRRGIRLSGVLHGADHERGLRPGTENIMGIAGLGEASRIISLENNSGDQEQKIRQMQSLRDHLHQGIMEIYPETKLNGHPEKRLPNTLSLGFKGKNASLLLDQWKGLAASAGAACHAGTGNISYVLSAMKTPAEYARGTVRFSTGKQSTLEEIDEALTIIRTGNRRRSVCTKSPSPPYIPVMASAATPETSEIRLTGLTLSPGCGCKINPRILDEILKKIPRPEGPRILVGTETSDDAAVYLISKSMAIVQTLDFMPPVADDPFDFGAVAAANALSDIYAMGAKPLFALNILAFPAQRLPAGVLDKIMAGALAKAAEAGISVIGGHSIENEEPMFGLAVTGRVHPEKIWKNFTVRTGDCLILTKPLGTGIISTAGKWGFASSAAVSTAIRQMSVLNKTAAGILGKFGVHACTDVSGFGLNGHLKEMLSGGKHDVILNWKKIPVLPFALDYAVAGMIPGMTELNLENTGDRLKTEDMVPEIWKLILADPQTSGGLLAALPEPDAQKAMAEMNRRGITQAGIIGRVTKGNGRIIISG